MRILRPVVVVALVVAALALVLTGVNIAVAEYAERRAERRATEVLSARADVELHGFPVGLRILVGDIARAEMTARRVPLERERVRISRLDVVLEDVKIGLSDLRDPPETLPPARSGRFEAHIDRDAFWQLASIPEAVLDVTISDGAVRVRALGFEAAADVRVSGGDVVLVPRTPLGTLAASRIALDISDQPGSPRVEEAEIVGNTLVLRGSLQEVRTGSTR